MRVDLTREAMPPTASDISNAQVVTLLDQYEVALYRYLLTLTRDKEAARDCLQQTFLLALDHLQRGKDVNASWLYKVARSKATDELRYRRRVSCDLSQLETVPAASKSTRSAAVIRVLAQLLPAEQELLYLYDVDGLTAKELGPVLGIKESGVRMRILRAREHFRVVFATEVEQ